MTAVNHSRASSRTMYIGLNNISKGLVKHLKQSGLVAQNQDSATDGRDTIQHRLPHTEVSARNLPRTREAGDAR